MKLYIAEFTRRDGNPERFYKLGITGHRDTDLRFAEDQGVPLMESNLSRFEITKLALRGHRSVPFYDVRILHEFEFPTLEAAKRIEDDLLKAVSGRRYKPEVKFSGHTECFTADVGQLDLLVEYIQGIVGQLPKD